MKKIEYLYDRLAAISQVELYTMPPREPFFVPVLSFNIKGETSENVGEYLAQNGIAVRCGLHCAPLAHEKMGTEEGTVRVSPSVFTRREEIDLLLSRIRGYRLGKNGR